MRHTNFALALLTAAVLSACGGSDNNNDPAPQPKPKFASQVAFGDSLSDVGTYRVGTIAAAGGGKYTINGPTAKNWTEIMAASFGLTAPCPAQQGLNGLAARGFFVPVINRLECTNYAQGGSRVTEAVGPGNAAISPLIGQLTIPVTAQIDNHLTRNGDKFSGNEIVFVMAGGNDALLSLTELENEGRKRGATAYAATLVPALAAGATSPASAAQSIGLAFGAELNATGSLPAATTAAIRAAAMAGNTAAVNPAVNGPIIAKATLDATAAGDAYAQSAGPGLVTKMSTAGSELASMVRAKIVGKGAKYVVVNNLPDIAAAPASLGKSASARTLIAGMVSAFNTALRANLDGLDSNVLYVDLFTVGVDQATNPGKYGLTNVTAPACNLDPAVNPIGSLICTEANLAPGVTPASAATYLFADSVHPTPYGNKLIADHVTAQLKLRGWL